jgi:hypothetical protein
MIPSDNPEYSVVWHLSGPVKIVFTEFCCTVNQNNEDCHELPSQNMYVHCQYQPSRKTIL